MGQKSISQLDTIAQAHDTDLFEVAAIDAQSASGYKSGKMSAEVMAEGLLSTYTYPTAMPNMQNKTITGALNQLLANFAPAYDDTETYSVGDVCTYNGQLYKCTTAVSTAETFDPTKWDAIDVTDIAGSGTNSAIAPMFNLICIPDVFISKESGNKVEGSHGSDKRYLTTSNSVPIAFFKCFSADGQFYGYGAFCLSQLTQNVDYTAVAYGDLVLQSTLTIGTKTVYFYKQSGMWGTVIPVKINDTYEITNNYIREEDITSTNQTVIDIVNTLEHFI